jgi:hypothetical protein
MKQRFTILIFSSNRKKEERGKEDGKTRLNGKVGEGERERKF